MFTVLYPISYIITLGSLVAWFYFQSSKPWYVRLSRLFIVGLLAYFVSVYLADASVQYKMGTMFRDLMLMGGIGFLFQILARQKRTFLIGTILLIGGMNWFFQTKLQSTFPQSMSVSNLDTNGELLIELGENYQLDQLAELQEKYNLDIQRAFFPASAEQTELDDYYVVNIPSEQEAKLRQIKRDFRKTGLIDWLEENETVNVSPLPSKGNRTIKEKFGINDPGIAQLWAFEQMKMDELYTLIQKEKIQPKKKALIAILDTGVDAKHEDISANYKSLKSKHDNDPRGHGTHCAGIAAAVSNNGKGVASFSQNNEFVEVASIKVLNSMGMGTQKSIIDGIIEAADSGADIISMSLGGRSNQAKQTAYKKAVKYANQKGAIVVAAAGNSNRNAKEFSPVNAPGVIGVSAVDVELNRAVFSNYVQDIEMGIAAPGVDIYSTIPGNKYATYNGTSMATPYVSGLLGLMKSINPDLTTKEAHVILKTSGVKTKATKETGQFIQPAMAVKIMMKE